MSNDTQKLIYYRAWIKPIEQWADELLMEFTSYGFPPRFTAFMQDKHLEFNQDDLIIEQYAGLQDKNDKGIYEGDVLRNYTGAYHIVNFNAELSRFMWSIQSFDHHTNHNLEVIGNIHQNPELLEGIE